MHFPSGWEPGAAKREKRLAPSELAAPLLLLFASGFAALVYEVLWLRELALLFGSTARSAATTLAVFFLGMAIGSALFARRAERSCAPLRDYALLEIGIAAAAVAYFGLRDLSFSVYRGLFDTFQTWPAVWTLTKLGLAATLLGPAAVCMGGTLPLLAQHVVRSRADLGRVTGLLYATNTIGGGLGALAAGFYLPPLLGFRGSYLLAIAINVLVAVLAMVISWRFAPAIAPSRVNGPLPRHEDALPRAWLVGVAAVSGFAALGLEVLWTRMFAQVLHNSVYSFAAILVTFLVSLALGGALASRLHARGHGSVATLGWLSLGAGLSVGLSPFVFYAATGGLQYVASQAAWSGYVASIFGLAALVCLPPGIFLGSLFPLVVGLVRMDRGAGFAVGRLSATNTLGAIVGSLVAGFVLLEWMGLWASIGLLATVYLLLSFAVAGRLETPGLLRVIPVAGLGLLATVANPARLPIFPDLRHLGDDRPAFLDRWEGRDGTVAVALAGEDLRITVDGYYSLGGTAAARYEQTQADLPLLLHPAPRSAFFLGLGTGITAGAALHHPLERLVVAELSAHVAEASQRYFGKYTNGLFSDPRTEIVVEDGRNHLLGTSERFDVIVADLFIPWRAGEASLYSREHFATVRERLAPGGLFAQWLPFYQLSRAEAEVIVRTLLDVFPHVTLWRGDFLPDRPILALVASAEPQVLDPDSLTARFRARRKSDALTRDDVLGLTAMFYAGNLGHLRDLFSHAPIHTDDRPLLEYTSPVTQRQQRAGAASFFTSLALEEWYRELAERLPPGRDPYLARLSAAEQGFVTAGLVLFAANVAARRGDARSAGQAMDRFAALVPERIAEGFRREVAARTDSDVAGAPGRGDAGEGDEGP